MVETKKDVKTTVKPVEKAVEPTAARAEVKQAAPIERIETEAVAAVETETAPTEKAPAKRAAAKRTPVKTTAVKKEPVKKDIVKKGTVRKGAEKKEVRAPTRETTAKKAEPKVEVHFQFNGKDLVAKDVLDRTIRAYESNHKGVEIETIELYIVANEGTAYCVMNEEANDDFKVVLQRRLGLFVTGIEGRSELLYYRDTAAHLPL